MQQITILSYMPHYLVPIQTGKFSVNKKKAGFEPKKNEERLHYALGTAEKGPGFRKNGYYKEEKLPDDRSPSIEG